MTTWGGMVRRSNSSKEVRKEDIHKCTVNLKAVGTQQFRTYDHIRISDGAPLRYHKYHLEIKDERFNKYVYWHIGIVTELGDTGKDTLYRLIYETLGDYGEFDGFTCNEEDSDMTQYNTDKNRERVKEIRKKIDQHNLELVSQHKKEYK